MTTTENNNRNNLILTIVLGFIVLLFMTSCGSRKVNKSKTQETEQKEVKTELIIETKVIDNTKILDTSTSDEIEICPVSDTLPMVVNGITYINAKIKRSKKKNNISIVKDVKVQQNVQKSDLKTVKTNKVVETKQIERKQSFWWLLWFLLLIPIYYLWRKYRVFFI
jgi:hypothetical protein